jgi:hypothetical protein
MRSNIVVSFLLFFFSLREDNERLDDAIEFLIHDLEGPAQLVKTPARHRQICVCP